jgi:hypothetical protein
MNGNKPFSAKDAKIREEDPMDISVPRPGHLFFFAFLRVLRGSSFFNGEA